MRSTASNLQVLFEDNHLLVVNKRSGDIVQGDKTGDKPLSEVCKEYIAKKYDKPGAVFLGVVHRLDRPTSGVLIFARTSKALTRLNKQFQERQPEKVYWAIVAVSPPKSEDRLVHYMVRNPKQNKSYAHLQESSNSKKAVLNYKVLKKLDRYYLLEIQLETGRHHQIRSQLSAIGCPVKGDLKYGAKRSNPNGSIHLHARKISLVHPVRKDAVVCTAPLPSDPIWNACGSI